MTPKRLKVLAYIAHYQAEHGYSPSYKEIARGIGRFSESNIHKHIFFLEFGGFLEHKEDSRREVTVTLKGYEALAQPKICPVCGNARPSANI